MSADTHPRLQLPGDGSFPAGTSIAVPGAAAAVAVEHLARGSHVLTLAGPVALRHITEIPPANADADAPPARLLPVLVEAGACGTGLPSHDLLLPPHALLHVQDSALPAGALAPLGALVNGTTIRRTPAPGITWYRLELEQPGIVLADGLPVAARHDPTAPPPAAILPPGPAIAALRARLAAIGAPPPPPEPPPEPAAKPGPDMTAAPDPATTLRLVANNRALAPEPDSTETHWHFILPEGTVQVALLSPPGLPATMPATQRATARRYGVALRAILLDGTPLVLEAPTNAEGFHDLEVAGTQSWRWTDGHGRVSLPPANGERRLTVEITDWHTMLQRD